jgi:chemotaxis protein CheD
MIISKPAHFFLHPSSVYANAEPVWVTTVLGSCVSVCFIDETRHLGGMNHFMLPFWNGVGLESPRYGNVAIKQLFRQMLDLGAKKDDIVCKIFGGAEILGEQTSLFNIGQRNIDIAFKMIEEMNIPVKSSSTGGRQARRIHFNTFTGEVLQKCLINSILNNKK